MTIDQLQVEEVQPEEARRGERVHAPGDNNGLPVAHYDEKLRAFYWMTRQNSVKKWWKLKLPDQQPGQV